MSKITTEITLQDGVVKQVVRRSESIKVSDEEEALIKVVEANEEEEQFDSYPEPDDNFVYEDPYVTAEEMRQIQGNNEVKRPRKPASGYFYFAKSIRCLLQRQHPTWPMKRIMSSVAAQWANKSEEERAPFMAKAKEDSERYRSQMLDYSKTDAFKVAEKANKKRKRQKARLKASTADHAAFELFCKDHGGTAQEVRQLWKETDPAIKAEYESKALVSNKPARTRSRREIKLPARLSDSVVQNPPFFDSTRQSSNFGSYVSSSKNQFPNKDQEKLRGEWEALSEDERKTFATTNAMPVNYRALAEGDLFFDLDNRDRQNVFLDS